MSVAAAVSAPCGSCCSLRRLLIIDAAGAAVLLAAEHCRPQPISVAVIHTTSRLQSASRTLREAVRSSSGSQLALLWFICQVCVHSVVLLDQSVYALVQSVHSITTGVLAAQKSLTLRLNPGELFAILSVICHMCMPTYD